MKKIVFIAITEQAKQKACLLQRQFSSSMVVTTQKTTLSTVTTVDTLSQYLSTHFHKMDAFCFITAMGICVRTIAPYLGHKKSDPAVVCMDDSATFVQSVLGGHQAAANDFANKIAGVFGAQTVLSTSSDVQGLWSLDTLAKRFQWKEESSEPIKHLMQLFVNRKPTALLLHTKDKGTDWLEETKPDFVHVFYEASDINAADFELLIAVSPLLLKVNLPTLAYRPSILHVGSGCSKALNPAIFEQELSKQLRQQGFAPASIKSLASIDIKAQQEAYIAFAAKQQIPIHIFTKEEITAVNVPNPSAVVQSKIGVEGVSESTAMLAAQNDSLLLQKQKVLLDNGQKFTFAVAVERAAERKAAIAIIGAGPGDELLITVKGKNILQQADCILYAGSLVPEAMTNWCKQGAVVMNSAMMTLEEQINVMQEHYDQGHLIVRLHSGDPSVYGAIQEQMSIFDALGMYYFIVPGISSFSAAAAALKSEFTIPEVVQSVILTRGAGKTPLPESENLEEMAKHKATMCIFLSATLVKKVEAQLLQHYDPDTPVAVLYRVTWEDEEIYTGTLKELATIVKKSKKKRTVLFIIGACIGARRNRSQLYSPEWYHIFRKRKKKELKA